MTGGSPGMSSPLAISTSSRPASDPGDAEPSLLRRADVGCQSGADRQKAGQRCTIEEGAFALTHQLLTVTLPVEALAAKHPPQHITGTKWIPIGHPPERKR